MVIRIIACWMSFFVGFVFLGLYLDQGTFTLYEHNAYIRLGELIGCGVIFGYTIYEAIRYYRGIKS